MTSSKRNWAKIGILSIITGILTFIALWLTGNGLYAYTFGFILGLALLYLLT